MRSCFLAFVAMGSLFAAPAAVGADTPAKHLSDIVQEADSVTIEYYSPSGKDEVAFADKPWLERLAAVLERSSYTAQSHCFCISYPQIHLYRKNEKIGTLSVHHGIKLRAYVSRVSGDFLVGAAVGKAIVDLAIEKKKG
jgi:hypothetical protein